MANKVTINYNDGTAETEINAVTAITVTRQQTGLKDDTRPLMMDVVGTENPVGLGIDLHNVDGLTLEIV